jgi:hypothetical protein
MNVEEVFKQAALSGHICELKDKEGRIRVAEPYMIFTTSLGLRCFAVVQLSGYSTDPADFPNWRNIPVHEITSVKILNEKFKIREDYQPANERSYPQPHFGLKGLSNFKKY